MNLSSNLNTTRDRLQERPQKVTKKRSCPRPVQHKNVGTYIGQHACDYVLIHISLFSASSQPFVLTVVTDNTELQPNNADFGNRGFSLNYQQLPCM